jgi:PAS domain S-box-containing protein
VLEPPLSTKIAASLLDELRSYVGFTKEDGRLLAELLPKIRASLPAVADEFYAIIRLHPGAFAVIKDEEQARRLHGSLQVWMEELLSGVYDVAYFMRHARIGQVHVRVGLPQHYMVAAMSRVEESLIRLASDANGDESEQQQHVKRAISRICALDLSILLESYRRDWLARLRRVQRSQRDALEADLGERRSLLDDALEVADAAVVGFDEAGQVLLFNKKAEQLTGFAKDEMLGTDPFERLFGERATRVRASFFEAREDMPQALDSDLVTRSGRVRTVSWRVAAHRTQPGGARVFVAVGMDVSEQRELERRARRNERLAAAGVLAAGLAHEIRNPLNGAGLHLSILERSLARSVGITTEASRAVQVVRAEIGRLSSLVTEFLEVARPVALSLADHDLNEVVGGVVTLMSPEANSRGTQLRVEPCPLNARGCFDEERVKQALLNLVKNAIEAVAHEGEVVVRVRRTAGSLEVDVQDDGPGLDASAPIFDAFYTTKDGGTGLGLSIVQRVVTDHGGDVRFTTEPGCTVFTMTFPQLATGSGVGTA